MPETDRLGYSRGIMDQLRTSHEQLSREELLDMVCHLTKTYVLDRTLPFALPHPEREQAMRHDRPDAPLTRAEVAAEEDTSGTTAERFARLIDTLKVRTGLPQLELFETDAERAVLMVDNQKITFGERVTVEFVPRRGTGSGMGQIQAAGAPISTSAPSPRRTPGAPEEPAPPPRPAASAPPIQPNKPAAPPPPEEGDDGYDPSVERFRRLDLD